MNRRFASTLSFVSTAAAALAFAAIAAGPAYAENIADYTTSFAGTKTRAEVQADFVQYKKTGVNPWSWTYNPLKYFASGTSREQVQQEFLAAREEVKAMTGEDSGSFYLAAHGAQQAGTKVASR